ncbi:hypothetical protein C0992_010727 [Termitomyces sp. T32_za158]|nr:hypothetical protein C0992_010727 [Termitomyces sp. T32_za158]
MLSELTFGKASNEHGIPVKKRLSFGALALRPPKVISGTVSGLRTQAPPLKATYTSFMPLGFKKGIVPTSSMAIGRYPELQEPTLSSINALPSPSHYTQDHFDGESLQTQRMQDHNKHGEADDEFSEDFMFRSFTNVLKSAEEYAIESLHPPSPLRECFSTSKLPQESWTWSGDVFTDAEASSPAFSITINGVTPIVDEGPSLSEVLIGMEHLLFTNFYDAVDIDSILSACQEIRQFATLVPRSSADIENFDLFCTYMAKLSKVVFLPISLDGFLIGHTVFFHPDTISETSRLMIPLDIPKDIGLAAALVLWTLSKSQLSGQSRCINYTNQYLSSKTDMEPLLEDRSLWLRSIMTKPHYHRGLRILQFPRMLFEYLCENVYERTYSVWYEGADGTRKRPGIETCALYCILEECGCKRSRTQEARIVFIHLGAIKYLHKLPGFLDICSTSFSVRLYSYGSHETIPRGLWGIHEIYPCDVDGWLEKFWTHRPKNPRATFQACLDEFNDRYQEFLQMHWTSVILAEISKELRCMRTQPVFVEKYRRYVVLDSPRAHPENRKDALEWTSTTKFDFKDDFFPTQE